MRQSDAAPLASTCIELQAAAAAAYAAPRLFGPLPPGWSAPWPDITVLLPALTLCEWKGASVIGKVDAVLAGGVAVVNDHWREKTERTFDEVTGLAVHDPNGSIKYYRFQSTVQSFPRAIVIGNDLVLGST